MLFPAERWSLHSSLVDAHAPTKFYYIKPILTLVRLVEPTYATEQEDPVSRGSTVRSMSFHRGARDSNTLPKSVKTSFYQVRPGHRADNCKMFY